jgi:hypothetical protein
MARASSPPITPQPIIAISFSNLCLTYKIIVYLFLFIF